MSSSSLSSFDITKKEWSDVAPLNLFGRAPQKIRAVAFGGCIAVIFSGGMSVLDLMFNKWHKKAAPTHFDSETHIICSQGQLKILYDSASYYSAIYCPFENEWITKEITGADGYTQLTSDSHISTILYKTVSSENQFWVFRTEFVWNDSIRSYFVYDDDTEENKRRRYVSSTSMIYSCSHRKKLVDLITLVIPNCIPAANEN